MRDCEYLVEHTPSSTRPLTSRFAEVPPIVAQGMASDKEGDPYLTPGPLPYEGRGRKLSFSPSPFRGGGWGEGSNNSVPLATRVVKSEIHPRDALVMKPIGIGIIGSGGIAQGAHLPAYKALAEENVRVIAVADVRRGGEQ